MILIKANKGAPEITGAEKELSEYLLDKFKKGKFTINQVRKLNGLKQVDLTQFEKNYTTIT